MGVKYVFVTGGVVSGLGKGITAASLGRLLKARGYHVTMQKLDPYINVDPGTMNPIQHGEVFVTDDGTETDLDLGHYERFIDESLDQNSNVTTGKIYWSVLHKERHGDYGGGTVQVIPHITNEIKSKFYREKSPEEDTISIIEVGGTVGDIESQPFLEAIRQFQHEMGRENAILIQVTLIPYLKASGEMKTKPTQMSVKQLQSMGIWPDILVCRSDYPIDEKMKEKIDEPRVYLAVVLNQILTLATMSIYQKGFGTLAVEHIQIHRLLQKVIPHIRKAVSAKTCRACMEEAVEICGLLASEIIDACKLTPLEELLAQLNQQFPQNQSFPADSRTEQTGEGGESQLFSLFGSSDLTANQEQEQTQNATAEQVKEAEVHAAMKDADQASREEIGIFIKTGKREQPAKDEVTSSQEDVLPDLTSVQNTYNGMVTFTEKKRTYHPDQQMPVTLLARARNLKRKVEKIFKNRQGLSLRGQNKGKIDAAKVYKLAMNRMDFFKRTQRSEPFEGCVYLLLDNSGSMGNGRMSKRNYCCGAAAVIEYAFSEHVLLKETAFTAYTDYIVEHTVIKDWHEHVSSNAAWNFYEKDSCASCNKDGYSIRVATKELLARVEKNKLLIVISDGLPSAYPGGREDGIEDVHAAVREARKAGIQVIAIYIQDDDNRREAEEFRQMYETNCITTQPEQIEAELVHILKRFCFR